MVWYICLGAAVFMVLTSVRLALDRRRGDLRVGYVLLALILMSFILYAPIFFSMYNPMAAIFGELINLFQIVSLDADYLNFYEFIYEGVEISFFRDIYLFLLGISHVVLPLTVAATAYTFILHYISGVQMMFVGGKGRTLYIFSNINDRAVFLARSIRGTNQKANIIFCGASDKSMHTELRKELRCVIWYDRISEWQLKRKMLNDVHYYCVSEDEERNLDDALSLIDHISQQPQEQQKHQHIWVFSERLTAIEMLDSADKGIIDVKLLRPSEFAIYNLLDRYPLYEGVKEGRLNILICGFDQIGMTFLRTAAWYGQIEGCRLSLRVITKDAKNREGDVKANFPGLSSGRYDIRFFNADNRDEMLTAAAKYCMDATHIVVCEGSDTENIQKAIVLRRQYYKKDGTFMNEPVIFAHVVGQDKHESVEALRTPESSAAKRRSYDIIPFGSMEEVYLSRQLDDEVIEKLARNVHLVYEDIFSEGEIDVEAALRNYNVFEVNKRSNRANAMHIRVKLHQLGLGMSEDPEAEEVSLEDYLNEETLERLTRAEHDRWMAFLDSEGWTGATLEEVRAYQSSGLSAGRHNCPLLKMHPYICDFDDLQACSEALGLPDSTVYDRELIRRIPDILHDRWGVSGKKYKIISLNGRI